MSKIRPEHFRQAAQRKSSWVFWVICGLVGWWITYTYILHK